MASRVLCATLKLQATGCSDTELSLGVQQFGSTPGVSSFLTVLNNHINFHLFVYLEHSSHHFTNHESSLLYKSSDRTSARRQNWTERLALKLVGRCLPPRTVRHFRLIYTAMDIINNYHSAIMSEFIPIPFLYFTLPDADWYRWMIWCERVWGGWRVFGPGFWRFAISVMLTRSYQSVRRNIPEEFQFFLTVHHDLTMY